MPLLYMTPSELSSQPLGQALQGLLSQLGSGVLDQMLMRASKRCNAFTKRRLQAPQSTTIASPSSAGDTMISVASTLGTDNLDEFAVTIGSGGSPETVLLQPGGVKVSSYVAPYPGTFTLASPLQYNHSTGEAVNGIYIETRRTGSSSQDDIYEDVVTQQAQVAAAHGGGYDFLNADRARYHWLDQYPLIQIFGMQHAYPYTAEYQAVDTQALLVEPAMSRIKFDVGTFILSGGMLKTTYTAGYQNIDDDIQIAVMSYLKDELANYINPFGIMQQTTGKQTMVFNRSSNNTGSKTPNVQAAEDALAGYKR